MNEKREVPRIWCDSYFGRRLPIPADQIVFRPSVYGLIRSLDGECLLLIEQPKSARLVLPGGGVETHESLTEALRRECREETGLGVAVAESPWRFRESFFHFEPTVESWHVLAFYFECRLSDERDDMNVGLGNPIEGKPVWIRTAKLWPSRLAPSFRPIVSDYCNLGWTI